MRDKFLKLKTKLIDNLNLNRGIEIMKRLQIFLKELQCTLILLYLTSKTLMHLLPALETLRGMLYQSPAVALIPLIPA